MTDNEIRQALLCHESWGIDSCDSCPLTPGKACGMQLAREALELINRQKAEIEALIAGQETLQKYIATARSETIKAFAERASVKITEVYNKHIFGCNDLEAEEKDAIINFCDDVTRGLEELAEEMTEGNP